MNKRKLYGTLIAVIAFAILIAGATFAWFTYAFNATNGVYNTVTACFDINYTTGQDINTTLKFSTDYQDLSIDSFTRIKISRSPGCSSTRGNITLNILPETTSTLYSVVPAHCEDSHLNTLPNYTTSSDCTGASGTWITNGSALKYYIVDDYENILTQGYITKSGINIIYENFELIEKVNSSTPDNYIINIWLDGELADENYSANTLSGYISVNATQSGDKPNAPKVSGGLIPVKLSDTGNTVTTVAENDSTWYDYDAKKWANAILISETTHTRDYYLSHPGTTVPQADILAYYVWIPRYSYKVWKYTSTNNDAGAQIEIPIKFVAKNTKEVATANGMWHTHPAFTLGDTEMAGIWVGKFEVHHITYSTSTSANSLTTSCGASACARYTGLRILPNVKSLRYNRISNFFYAARHMEEDDNPFGIDPAYLDSHMIKNSEWGAVAYISHSRYGINTEVAKNASDTYITGCGSSDSTCSASNPDYGTRTTYEQSTTGNVTGIFDMVGGANEFVMCKNGTSSSGSGSNSGFTDTLLASIEKYNNLYGSATVANCEFTICGGHAMRETRQWYSDLLGWPNSSNVYIYRSGSYSDNISDIGMFYSHISGGSSYAAVSARFILSPK